MPATPLGIGSQAEPAQPGQAPALCCSRAGGQPGSTRQDQADLQVQDQAGSVSQDLSGYRGEMEHRDLQGGSEWDASPQVGQQTQEDHGWVQGQPEQSQKHLQHSWDWNPSPQPKWSPQAYGQRVWEETSGEARQGHQSPLLTSVAAQKHKVLQSGERGSCWGLLHGLALRSIKKLLSG